MPVHRGPPPGPQHPPGEQLALFGAIRRARSMEEQQQQQQSYTQQQQSALAQGHANYNRAFGACMAGRGYTVQS